MRRENGRGSIVLMSGNRKKQYAIRVTVEIENGKQKYKYLSYHRTKEEAELQLSIYEQNGNIKEPKFRNHGQHHTRLYNVWVSMIARCYNPNTSSYKWYGAKGIKVCEEWRHSFYNFMQWAINNGYDATAQRGKCTIDRINTNGNYEPNNCRWVDMKTQNSNKRTKCTKMNCVFVAELP